MARRVERVVIVGRDAAAWLTALGLHRAYGRLGVRIELIELPSRLGPADVFAATPALRGLHNLLGLPEAALYQACGAMPSLGQRFVDWSGDGAAFLNAYDVRQPAIDDIPFLQFWVKARAAGLTVPLEDFSIAAAAAKQGRIAPRDADPEAPGIFVPGYHLDALSYVALLRQAARQAGIVHHAEKPRSVERNGDWIEALVLADGTRLAADLFIDASGAETTLIGAMPVVDITDWSEWLGCDRLLTASGPALDPAPPFSQVTAFDRGWIGLYPLQRRTALIAAFQSDGSDKETVQRIAAVTRMPLGGARVTAIAPGARTRPWIGNCVAIGAAAACIEPLDATDLQLVQISLSNLVALWPVEAERMPEAAAYNEAIASHLANVRDFAIAHYRLNRRVGEPFWQAARDAKVPATLDAKLALFAARGQVPLYDDESFESHSWSASFVGHGLIPRSYDPLVETIPAAEQIQKFQGLLRMIAEQVHAMPDVATYMAGFAHPAG